MLILKEAPVLHENLRTYQNDCTIHALSTSLNITYDFALAILQHVNPISDKEYVVLSKKRTKSDFSKSHNYRALLKLFANEKTWGAGQPTWMLANSLKGTHIALERGHAKVLHEGYCIDTHNTTSKTVFNTYRIYRSKYMPFLQDVADKLGMDLEEHTQRHSLNHYIKNFNYQDYVKEKQRKLFTPQSFDEFKKHAISKNIDPNLYNKEIYISGEPYVIMEIKPRNRKYPIIAASKENKKRYKLSLNDVNYLLGA